MSTTVKECAYRDIANALRSGGVMPMYSLDAATGDLYESGEHVGKLATGSSGAAWRLVNAGNANTALMAALEKADTLERLANELACCKTIREATDRKLHSKLASAQFEYREARAALKSANQ